MKRPMHELIAHGVAGGVLAGVVVALWFLVIDSLAGQPFRTPALLAAALSGQQMTVPTFRPVLVYTVAHFGVFAFLGIVVAWAIAALEVGARLLFGVVFGIVAQEVVFYAALFVSGARLVAVVPWPQVIAANVLSGIALMAYLHRAQRDERPFGLAALQGHPLLARGLVTGLVGAAAVALWFFMLDVAGGRPFRTPAALGSALLLGASNVAGLQLGVGVVAVYTVVHVAAFAVAGTVFVAIAEEIERAPALLLLVVLACIVLDAVVVAALALEAQWVLGTLGVWSVLAANLLAVCSMGWHVWRTHPRLRHRLRKEPLEVRV